MLKTWGRNSLAMPWPLSLTLTTIEPAPRATDACTIPLGG
jgi:hypothetical protein